MTPFKTFSAIAAPFEQPNIDTDQIIPARFLGKPRAAQVDGLFRDVRFADDGSERPGFVLNKPGFRDARIIVAGRNFACGSSRENAVTALLDNGFKVFVAPSFGDIFYNNCFQNGVLPVRLPEARIAEMQQALLERQGTGRITVDLAAQSITGPDGKVDRFEIDGFRKDSLLRGMDMLELTSSHDAEIAAFEQRQRAEMPWLG